MFAASFCRYLSLKSRCDKKLAQALLDPCHRGAPESQRLSQSFYCTQDSGPRRPTVPFVWKEEKGGLDEGEKKVSSRSPVKQGTGKQKRKCSQKSWLGAGCLKVRRSQAAERPQNVQGSRRPFKEGMVLTKQITRKLGEGVCPGACLTALWLSLMAQCALLDDGWPGRPSANMYTVMHLNAGGRKPLGQEHPRGFASDLPENYLPGIRLL